MIDDELPPAVAVAFRSSHPDVLARWAAWSTLRDEYDAKLAALRTEFDRGLLVYRHPWRFAALDGDDSPGPLWRRADRGDGWVPNRRTRAGRELATRLDGIRLGLADMVGTPLLIRDGRRGVLHTYRPGLDLVDGVLWLTWSVDSSDLARVDPVYWERVRLSEYHRAMEIAAGDEPACDDCGEHHRDRGDCSAVTS